VDNCGISIVAEEPFMSLVARSLRAIARSPFVTAMAVAGLLVGCASPASIRPGASEGELAEQFGRPDSMFVLSDGSKRLEYNRGEFMQRSWMVDIDAGGHVVRVDQVRDEAHFAQLRPGTDDKESVRRALGTPWKVEYYPPSRLTGWLYPYRESGVFNSVMTVMFDPAGVLRRAENGPDPRFLVNDNQGRQ
jgi:hypothetical protein